MHCTPPAALEQGAGGGREGKGRNTPAEVSSQHHWQRGCGERVEAGAARDTSPRGRRRLESDHWAEQPGGRDHACARHPAAALEAGLKNGRRGEPEIGAGQPFQEVRLQEKQEERWGVGRRLCIF